MQKSFKKWHDVSPLTFIELVNKPKNTAQIRVLFTRGTHGDPYPFDGRGGTLAHAFYPHNNAGIITCVFIFFYTMQGSLFLFAFFH